MCVRFSVVCVHACVCASLCLCFTCLYACVSLRIYKQGSPFNLSLHPVCIRSQTGCINILKKGSWDAFKLKQVGPGTHTLDLGQHASCIPSVRWLFAFLCWSASSVLDAFLLKLQSSNHNINGNVNVSATNIQKKAIVLGPFNLLTHVSRDPLQLQCRDPGTELCGEPW